MTLTQLAHEIYGRTVTMPLLAHQIEVRGRSSDLRDTKDEASLQVVQHRPWINQGPGTCLE